MHRSVGFKGGLVSAFLFIGSFAFAQFRVIGYVQSWGGIAPDTTKIDFKKITHLNIAFVNPDSAGSLLLPAGFDTIIAAAHNNNVKVLASIGGGSFNPHYARLLSETNSKAFAAQLVKLAVDHNLDGIDVDLEGDAIDKNYDRFIVNLSTQLKPLGKLLTAAFATWNAQLISTDALKKMDFINIMSYDQTGPWRPLEPGPHSTYAKAEEDLHYWVTTRGFPKKKINLGLPFYGYCFGTTYGESMSYASIITTFPGSDLDDMVVPSNGGIIHYNGLTTIQNKTAMALKNAGGVMIWQLLQDAEGDKSLLTAIDALVKNAAAKK